LPIDGSINTVALKLKGSAFTFERQFIWDATGETIGEQTR